jgi:hypothetical protein
VIEVSIGRYGRQKFGARLEGKNVTVYVIQSVGVWLAAGDGSLEKNSILLSDRKYAVEPPKPSVLAELARALRAKMRGSG